MARPFGTVQEEIDRIMRGKFRAAGLHDDLFDSYRQAEWVQTTASGAHVFEEREIAGEPCKMLTSYSGLYEGEIVTRLPADSAPQQPGYVIVARASNPRRAYSVPAVCLVRWDPPKPSSRPAWAPR